MAGCLQRTRHTLFLVTCFTLVLVLSTSSSGLAFSGSLDVVLVVDKISFVVGDRVNATVYVLDGAMLANADSVSLLADSGTYPSWSEFVTLTQVATGTYRGTFEILANMTGDFIPGIGLRAGATRGSVSDTDSTILNVPAQHTVKTVIALSKYTAAPGEEVVATVWTFFNSQLRDPNEVNVSAVVYDGLGIFSGSREYLRPVNVSTGIFRAAYVMPRALTQSLLIEIWASATFTWPNNSIGSGTSAPLLVSIVNPFIVWYHEVDLTNHSARLEVGVADRAGAATAGANVHLVATVCPNPRPCQTVSLQKATDGQGRAPFEVTLDYVDNPGYFGFWGYVTLGTINQTFSGVLQSPSVEIPLNALSLVRKNVVDVFAPGQKAVMNYTLLAVGRPLPIATLDYAIHTTTALIGYGRVVTDSAGLLTLNFTMPSDPVTVDVVWQNGSAWSQAHDLVTPELHWSVHLDPLRVGQSSHLTATLPSEGAPWAVSLALYPYNTTQFPELRPDWSEARAPTGIFWSSGTTVVDGSGLDARVTLPTYLPGDRDYFLWVAASSMNGTVPLRYVYSALVHVGGATPSEPFLLFIALGFAAIGVITAALAIAYVRKSRRTPSRMEPASGAPVGQELGKNDGPGLQPPKQ